MKTITMKERANESISTEPIVLTKEKIQEFLNNMDGKSKPTISSYRRSLEDLYDYLPDDKKLDKKTLLCWETHLKNYGYSENTIGVRVTAINMFLRFYGKEEFTALRKQAVNMNETPRLTREEYCDFLRGLKQMKATRYYLLVKIFANTDITVTDIKYLTTESLKGDKTTLLNGKEVVVPQCLKNEILEYAKEQDIKTGLIFVTKNKIPIDRSNITNALRKYAVQLQMDPGKCSPRALHKLYVETQKEIIEGLRQIYISSYEGLMAGEA